MSKHDTVLLSAVLVHAVMVEFVGLHVTYTDTMEYLQVWYSVNKSLPIPTELHPNFGFELFEQGPIYHQANDQNDGGSHSKRTYAARKHLQHDLMQQRSDPILS